MGVIDRVREDYPTLAFLLNDREVGPLLRDAVDPNKGFSPSTFQWKLLQTNWYKSRSLSARQYSIRAHTDPGEHKARIRDLSARIQQTARGLGANLTHNQKVYIANAALRQGLEPDHPLILNSMVAIARKQGGPGLIRSTGDALRAAWQSDFFLPLTTKNARNLAVSVARGEKTEQDWYNAGRDFAIATYPHLARQLKQGMTMGEMFAPHIQAVEQTLELQPGAIKPWGNSKWATIWKGTKIGNTTRSLSVAEAERLARSDQRFWRTEAGEAEDAGATQMMLNIFGARK